MPAVTTRARMRLPRGYVALRPDLGRVLRARRRDGYGKQETVADAIGVARETLSRIEAGRALPRPDTLDRLLHALDLEWDEVAVRGGTARPARVFHDTSRGESCHRLGRAIRAGREAIGLGLREAGARCGLSASQLSRIERGEALASRVLEEGEGQDAVAPDERVVIAADPFLKELARTGADLA